jgi:hypothetical protein
MKKKLVFVTCVSVLFTVVSVAWSGGNPNRRITEFEAADVTVADNATSAIQSDGLGTYQSFAEGFEAYSEYGRAELISGDREFILNLGNFVSGDASIDLSGPISDVFMRHLVANAQNLSDALLSETTVPAPGTTLYANPDNPQSVVFYFTATDGRAHAIAVSDDSGDISLSGYDFDGDGKNDAQSIHVSPDTVWGLYVRTTYTVIVGHGKNQTTEERETYDLLAEYTDMSLDLWLDLLGFQVQQFAVR